MEIEEVSNKFVTKLAQTIGLCALTGDTSHVSPRTSKMLLPSLTQRQSRLLDWVHDQYTYPRVRGQRITHTNVDIGTARVVLDRVLTFEEEIFFERKAVVANPDVRTLLSARPKSWASAQQQKTKQTGFRYWLDCLRLID